MVRLDDGGWGDVDTWLLRRAAPQRRTVGGGGVPEMREADAEGDETGGKRMKRTPHTWEVESRRVAVRWESGQVARPESWSEGRVGSGQCG